jgi:DNA invertase Pin-like site-specific DNA recombinase
MSKRVALYTRISPNSTKDDTVNQERDLIEFCKRQDWEIVAKYTDIHVSGNKKGTDRTKFKLMMLDASKKKFDILLFWSLDRLSREGAGETLQYLMQLNSYGVDYKSYTEQYLDSCGLFREAVVSIMACVAKQERLRLIERTNAGLQTARERGIKLGRAFATTITAKRKVALDVGVAKQMRENGAKLIEIAKKFKTSEATISRYLRK